MAELGIFLRRVADNFGRTFAYFQQEDHDFYPVAPIPIIVTFSAVNIVVDNPVIVDLKNPRLGCDLLPIAMSALIAPNTQGSNDFPNNYTFEFRITNSNGVPNRFFIDETMVTEVGRTQDNPSASYNFSYYPLEKRSKIEFISNINLHAIALYCQRIHIQDVTGSS